MWHIHWIPEGGLAIILGIVVGGCDYAVGGSMQHMLQLSPKLFQLFFLPPIIFDAGVSLNRKIFLSDIGTISLYAVIGTLITALLVGFIAFAYLKSFHEVQNESLIYECLLFGSLISATDPVASLAVFAQVFKIEEKPEPPLVYNLVFGESIINDAVAIVLYKSFEVFLHKPFNGGESVGLVIGEVLAVATASFAIGLFCGVLTSLIFKHFPSMKTSFNHQFFFLFIMSYSSFLLAEAWHFSGIMSVFVCGMVQSAFTWQNLTDEGRERLPTIFHAVAVLTENLIFCYLGMALFAFHGTHVWDWPFILTILAVVVFIRMIPVFGLTALANCFRTVKIDWRRQIVLWFAGLRGAIAFVLAVEMAKGDETPHGPMLMSATLVVCLFTTFVEGTLTRPLLAFLKLDTEEEPIRQEGPALKKFEAFVARYVRPYLCNPPPIVDGADKALAKGHMASDEEVELEEPKREEKVKEKEKPPAVPKSNSSDEL